VKFSYNHLRDLVPGLTVEPRRLEQLITMHTAESEGVQEWGAPLRRVVAARVLEVAPIENSHNVKALVDAGPFHGPKQVVCGAPNCRAGLLTAYVPSGTTIKAREIRQAVIGGVESDGMLASGAELEINRDHEGILELDGVEPGQPLPGCEPDFVIEVDNKSLNHRPDLWGHLGMAREVAAITGLRLQDAVDLSLIPDEPPSWHVEIRDPLLCPRYSALVFDNVQVGPSPLWLQARLEAIGLNPISNIVDVTNYVMAELAQPMHAFDAGKLHGNTILVRRAADGESFAALNGETYTLKPSHLVIADAQGPVALAGVIGGAGSAIGPSTTRIVLESANFEASSIRKTSTDVRLRTDASMRFEKAQDPANTVRALARAIHLLRQVSPGIRLSGGLVDQFFPPPPPAAIELPMEWLLRKLGRSVEPAEVRRILEALEFGVSESGPGVFSVSVPSWRATKDITIKDDLLEEVGRTLGYDTVPPTAPLQPVRRPWVNLQRLFHHRVRLACAAQGFTETSNYSFISDEMALRFGFPPARHLRVGNPISVEQSLMRTSLLPGIHRNIVDNARFFDDFRLFEIGREIHPSDSGLPREISHLMAAVYAKGDGAASLFELKRLAECLLPDCQTTPCPATANEHPARSAVIQWRGATVGRLFELHPKHVETGRAAVLDLDLDAIDALGETPRRYSPLRRFPSSAFDLSVVTGLRVLSSGIGGMIREAAGPGCDRVEYLYAYRGKPLADDRQSMTFRVTVSSPDHTLTNEEVTAARNAIIERLRQSGYELR
jgi:phenylalanyl-tRNA synthetase beta chain